jgi:hypothetical protein
MGTRGAIGFIRNGVVKATYNHFDSYPDGVGQKVVEYCRARDRAQLTVDCDAIRMVDEKVAPTDEDIARHGATADMGVGERGKVDWYKLLRKTQGSLEKSATAGVMIEGGRDFMRNSLFCEWAYLVNLDDGTLDVYRGFNRKPPTDGIFAGEGSPDAHVKERIGEEYYPCNRIARFPLGDLPGALADALPRDEDEDEDE